MRLALAFVLLVAGCSGIANPRDLRSPRTEAEWQEFNQHKPRVERVANALAKSNADLCGQHCFLTVNSNVADGIGAFSDTKQAYVTFPLLRFVRSDAELAQILGHEWAHILLGDNARATTDRRAEELRADCVGALLAARAGYDIAEGAQSMRRMQASPDGVMMALTNWTFPAWGERYDRVSRLEARVKGRPITRETIHATCGTAP